MKPEALYIWCMVCMLMANSGYGLENDFPVLTGPYLGQTPPEERPEMFAPGIISVEANFEHSAAVFSPDGKEVFWCTNVGGNTDKRIAGNLRLYHMKIVDGKWTSLRIAPFVKDIRVERPVFSPDGNRLYLEFGSDPYHESDTDIYAVERTAEGWYDPEPVSPLINSPAMERLHCVTSEQHEIAGERSRVFTRRIQDRLFIRQGKVMRFMHSGRKLPSIVVDHGP